MVSATPHNTSYILTDYGGTLDAVISRCEPATPAAHKQFKSSTWVYLTIICYSGRLTLHVKCHTQPSCTVVLGGVLTSTISGLRCRHHDSAGSTAGHDDVDDMVSVYDYELFSILDRLIHAREIVRRTLTRGSTVNVVLRSD